MAARRYIPVILLGGLPHRVPRYEIEDIISRNFGYVSRLELYTEDIVFNGEVFRVPDGTGALIFEDLGDHYQFINEVGRGQFNVVDYRRTTAVGMNDSHMALRVIWRMHAEAARRIHLELEGLQRRIAYLRRVDDLLVERGGQYGWVRAHRRPSPMLTYDEIVSRGPRIVNIPAVEIQQGRDDILNHEQAPEPVAPEPISILVIASPPAPGLAASQSTPPEENSASPNPSNEASQSTPAAENTSGEQAPDPAASQSTPPQENSASPNPAKEASESTPTKVLASPLAPEQAASPSNQTEVIASPVAPGPGASDPTSSEVIAYLAPAPQQAASQSTQQVVIASSATSEPGAPEPSQQEVIASPLDSASVQAASLPEAYNKEGGLSLMVLAEVDENKFPSPIMYDAPGESDHDSVMYDPVFYNEIVARGVKSINTLRELIRAQSASSTPRASSESKVSASFTCRVPEKDMAREPPESNTSFELLAAAIDTSTKVNPVRTEPVKPPARRARWNSSNKYAVTSGRMRVGKIGDNSLMSPLSESDSNLDSNETQCAASDGKEEEAKSQEHHEGSQSNKDTKGNYDPSVVHQGTSTSIVPVSLSGDMINSELVAEDSSAQMEYYRMFWKLETFSRFENDIKEAAKMN